MRFRKLVLDGYGRFSNRTLELAPGLQIVIGPNEQGKSTLRSFITDMLYGQKRSTMRPLYDPEHELRRPWSGIAQYGGRVVYELDDRRRIEITRSFNESAGSVTLYDHTNAREITSDFELLGNQEPTFAFHHLGLTKEVFLGTATFSHMTIDDLGDRSALTEIHDKLLSLADSGEETMSATMALGWLKDHIAAIGLPDAAASPLPMAQARLKELDEEWEAVHHVREELAAIQEKRRQLLDEERTSRRHRVRLQEKIGALERLDRAKRLTEADDLTRQIMAATERCFELGAVREFPLDRLTELQHAETALATAQAQVERMRAERRDLERQLNLEQERFNAGSLEPCERITEEIEIQLAELEARISRARDRVDEMRRACATAVERQEAAHADLDALPDFSGLASDPVEWLTHLTSSFRVAQRSRDDECATRDQLRVEMAARRDKLKGPQGVFAECDNFPELSREYALEMRVREEKCQERTTLVEGLRVDAEEQGEMLPGFLHMALFCAAGFSALFACAHLTGIFNDTAATEIDTRPLCVVCPWSS